MSFLLGIRWGKATRRPAAARRLSSAELARFFAPRSGASLAPAHPPMTAAAPPPPPHLAGVEGAQIVPMTSTPAAAEGSCAEEHAAVPTDVKSESTEEWSDSEAESDSVGEEQDLTSNCSYASCEDLRLAARDAEEEQGEADANQAAAAAVEGGFPATPELQEPHVGSPAWVPDATHRNDDVIVISSDDDASD